MSHNAKCKQSDAVRRNITSDASCTQALRSAMTLGKSAHAV